MSNKKIILDANILIRAVLGVKVISLIQDNYKHVSLFTPAICFQEAEK